MTGTWTDQKHTKTALLIAVLFAQSKNKKTKKTNGGFDFNLPGTMTSAPTS